MIIKVEHIGIAVKNLAQSNQLFARLLGDVHYKTEQVDTEGVSISFYKIGETKIELLEASSPDSPIAQFIQKKGEGIHHIAFQVDNIESEMNRLRQEGFELVNEVPRDGADNKRIVFLHPRSTGGVLVELCEERK